GKHDLEEGVAALKLVTNLLVNWMWLGFLLMAAATIVSLLPTGKDLASLRRLRLAPVSVGVSLGAAALSLTFGRVVLRIPWGATSALLALGGFTLGLTALAFYRMLDPLLRREATPPAERRAAIEAELQTRLAMVQEAAE
ncbi:MAG TPA: hypothetical protein VF518_01855, partial [Polyangia bacterium]